MANWLMKSEPETWSWQSQVKRGAAGEPWDGVRNHQANNFMKAMAAGDRAFFYHSGEERRIVGIVEIAKPWRPDPKDATAKFGMVQVRAVMPLPQPVTLAAIKAEAKLADLLLVRQSRLSVLPVDATAWALICRMGGLK